MIKIKGFTLTEVLIVVVVIAILAALALPRFTNQSERGVVAEAVAHLSAIRQAEEAYRLENSVTTYATDLSATGPLDIDLTQTQFTYSVHGTTGTVTATRAATASDDYKNKTITLKADGTWDQTLATKHPFSPQ